MRDAAGNLSPWMWTIPAAVAAAILAMYFLKTRRKPVLVPSTFLWRRTIEDHRVNALWQRLRRSVLLLLQLLAVAVATIALLRPSWQGTMLRGGRYVFLIDNSASMAATDVAPTRLADAKRRVLALIDQMGSGDTAMVVSFATSARIEQGFTDNRERLRRAVREIEATSAPSSLDEALRLCAARATLSGSTDTTDNAQPPADSNDPAASRRAQVFIVGDGNYPDVAEGLIDRIDPVFIPVGTTTAQNMAVTGLAVRRGEGNTTAQALAKVRNLSGAARTVDLELRRGDRLLDARRATVAAGTAEDVVFNVADAPDGVWELQIAGNKDLVDHLPVDDRAWAVLTAPQKARVLLVSAGDRYWRAAMATEEARRWCDVTTRPPSFLAGDEYQKLLATSTVDLVIFDRCRPEESPPCHTLYLDAVPPGGAWRSAAKIDVPQIIDVAQAHPLMQNVSLSEVLVAEAAPPIGPTGSLTLVESDRGPLGLVAPRGGYEDAVLGFTLTAPDGTPLTNWPLVDGAGFEQFTLNVVQYFGRGRVAGGGEAIRPGDPIRFRLDRSEERASVERPDGKKDQIVRSQQGEFAYYSTDDVGPYVVANGPAFAVNLFDVHESEVATASSPKLRVGDAEISGQTNWEPARLEGWKPFLLIVLVLLVGEWYIYGNRAGL
jgi:hypothetical protein